MNNRWIGLNSVNVELRRGAGKVSSSVNNLMIVNFDLLPWFMATRFVFTKQCLIRGFNSVYFNHYKWKNCLMKCKNRL